MDNPDWLIFIWGPSPSDVWRRLLESNDTYDLGCLCRTNFFTQLAKNPRWITAYSFNRMIHLSTLVNRLSDRVRFQKTQTHELQEQLLISAPLIQNLLEIIVDYVFVEPKVIQKAAKDVFTILHKKIAQEEEAGQITVERVHGPHYCVALQPASKWFPFEQKRFVLLRQPL
jgi:hypothetical protein